MNSRAGRRVEVVELDERGRRLLARRYPAMKGLGAAYVVATAPEVNGAMGDSLRLLADAANHGERLELERLVESLLPRQVVPSARTLEQARRVAQFRTRVLRDFGGLTAAEVSRLNGSDASNKSQLAYRWRKDGRIFAVPHRGRTWYLAFQFGPDGQPLAGVAEVLRHLGDWPEWDIAAWFVVSNAILERRRPVDLMVDAPELVGLAAQHEARRPAAGIQAPSGGSRNGGGGAEAHDNPVAGGRRLP